MGFTYRKARRETKFIMDQTSIDNEAYEREGPYTYK